MDFYNVEDQNGIRFSWNVLPTNRIDASSCSLPIGCLYTPLKQIPNHQPNLYEPVFCQTCRSFLNPYCSINFQNKKWKCPICNEVNNLPQSYHEMTPDCLAAEVLPEYTTIEYTLNGHPTYPPIFLFVVDTCMSEKEFLSLKTLLLQSISSLPTRSLVGLVTYGDIINVHELRFADFPHNFVFNGKKTYTSQDLRRYLSMKSSTNELRNDIIIMLDEAEQMLTTIIDNIEEDQLRVDKGDRASRCTGAALHLAVSLLETLYPKANSQIFLFTSGPITKGPGTMADIKRSSLVRQHREIEQGNAPMTQSAIQFFQNIALSACSDNTVINIISASFEECGLNEMESPVYITGGFMLFNESFSDENISKTLIKFFKGDVLKNSGVNCMISARNSGHFKFSGCVGPCVSGNAEGPLVSSNVIGVGGTTTWKACNLTPSTTLAFFFDITQSKADPISSDSISYLQFSTKYRYLPTNTIRLRVTTCALRFADLKTNRELIAQGFDQEAAAILLAKHSMFLLQRFSTMSEAIDIVHVIDRQLISFCRLFGEYTPEEEGSFQLRPNHKFLPQFIYHFRRSPFLSTFNSSPDQTATLRHALLCEEVTNSLFMIQPTLVKFALDQPPVPVMLDTNSLASDCVLLLDTYFRVLVWHGSTLAAWRDAGYHLQEEYLNLKVALESPIAEAVNLVNERFPTPLFEVCDQNSSLARYLLARCNPSKETMFDSYSSGASSDGLMTDEPSLSNFIQKLKQMAVTTG